MKGHFNERFKNLISFAAVTLYGIILLYVTYKINISEDETYTLNTTSRDFTGIIRQSYNFEAQPPVYFILLSWWRHLYPGVFFAKLFSILFIGLSTYVFYRLVLLIAGKAYARWMVLIFLLNPFTVWAALYMRTYSLLIFLSTISIYFFFRYYLENKKYFLYWFLFISLIGIYTQYFFTFLIATLAFIMLIFKGWKAFFRFCLYLIPLLLIFLPNLKFLPGQISIQESNSSHSPLTSIYTIIHTPQMLMLATNLLPSVWINRIVRIAFCLTALYAYLKLYKRDLSQSTFVFEKYNIVLVSLCFLIFLFCVGFVLTGVAYADNYLVVAFPFFVILFTVFRSYSPIVNRLVYGTLAIYFITLLTIHYRHPVKTYDFISAAKYIESIERPNEPVLIYRPAIALPFGYYYHGKNKIIPIPYPVKFESSYLINIKDTIELKQSIENVHADSKSYLLISDTTIYEGTLNMNRKMVTDYLNNHYNVILDTLYYGWSYRAPLQIRRFEKW